MGRAITSAGDAGNPPPARFGPLTMVNCTQAFDILAEKMEMSGNSPDKADKELLAMTSELLRILASTSNTGAEMVKFLEVILKQFDPWNYLQARSACKQMLHLLNHVILPNSSFTGGDAHSSDIERASMMMTGFLQFTVSNPATKLQVETFQALFCELKNWSVPASAIWDFVRCIVRDTDPAEGGLRRDMVNCKMLQNSKCRTILQILSVPFWETGERLHCLGDVLYEAIEPIFRAHRQRQLLQQLDEENKRLQIANRELKRICDEFGIDKSAVGQPST